MDPFHVIPFRGLPRECVHILSVTNPTSRTNCPSSLHLLTQASWQRVPKATHKPASVCSSTHCHDSTGLYTVSVSLSVIFVRPAIVAGTRSFWGVQGVYPAKVLQQGVWRGACLKDRSVFLHHGSRPLPFSCFSFRRGNCRPRATVSCRRRSCWSLPPVTCELKFSPQTATALKATMTLRCRSPSTGLQQREFEVYRVLTPALPMNNNASWLRIPSDSRGFLRAVEKPALSSFSNGTISSSLSMTGAFLKSHRSLLPVALSRAGLSDVVVLSCRSSSHSRRALSFSDNGPLKGAEQRLRSYPAKYAGWPREWRSSCASSARPLFPYTRQSSSDRPTVTLAGYFDLSRTRNASTFVHLKSAATCTMLRCPSTGRGAPGNNYFNNHSRSADMPNEGCCFFQTFLCARENDEFDRCGTVEAVAAAWRRGHIITAPAMDVLKTSDERRVPLAAGLPPKEPFLETCPAGTTRRCCSLRRSPLRPNLKMCSSVQVGAGIKFFLFRPGHRKWDSSTTPVSVLPRTQHGGDVLRLAIVNYPQEGRMHTSRSVSLDSYLRVREKRSKSFLRQGRSSRIRSESIKPDVRMRRRILKLTHNSPKCVGALHSAAGCSEGAGRGSGNGVFQQKQSTSKTFLGMPLLSGRFLSSSSPRKKDDSLLEVMLPRDSGSSGTGEGRGRSSSRVEGSGSEDSKRDSRPSLSKEARIEDESRDERQGIEPSELYMAAAAAASAALESMSRAEMLMGEAAKAAAAAQSTQAGTSRWPHSGASPLQATEQEYARLCQVTAAQHRVTDDAYAKAGVTLPVPRRAGQPTQRDLWLLSFSSSLPFVGFGLVDNFVMIVAGDMFDMTLCVALGLSTMTAAALGNWISDLMGLWLGSTIERVSSKALSIPKPYLTKEEMESPLCRRYYYIGTGLGISLGCLLGMDAAEPAAAAVRQAEGMAPLLFLDTKEGERLKQQREQAKTLHTDVAEAIAGYVRAERVVIYLLDPQEKAFRTEIDGHPVQIPLDAGIPGRVYATGLLVNWRPSFQDDSTAAAAPASSSAAADTSAAKERRAGAMGGLSPLCIGGSALPQPADLLPCCTRGDRVAAAAEAAAEDGAAQGEDSSAPTTPPAATPAVRAAQAGRPAPLAAEGTTPTVATAGELTTGGGGAAATGSALVADEAGTPIEAAASTRGAASTTAVAVTEVVGKERIERTVNLQQWAKVLQEKVLYAWRDNGVQSGCKSNKTKNRFEEGSCNVKEGLCDSSTFSYCRDNHSSSTTSSGTPSHSSGDITPISSSGMSDTESSGDLRRDDEHTVPDGIRKIHSQVEIPPESPTDDASAVVRPPAADAVVACGVAATCGASDAAEPSLVPATPSAIEGAPQSRGRGGLNRWPFSVNRGRSGAAAKEAGVVTGATEVKRGEVAEAATAADAATALKAATVAAATTEAANVERLYTVTLGRRWVNSAATRKATGPEQHSCSAQDQVEATIESTVAAAEEVLAVTAATIAPPGAAQEDAAAPVIAAAVVAAAEATVRTTQEAGAAVEDGGQGSATNYHGASAAITAAARSTTATATEVTAPTAAPQAEGASTGLGNPSAAALESAAVAEAAATAAAALVVVRAAGAEGAAAVAAASDVPAGSEGRAAVAAEEERAKQTAAAVAGVVAPATESAAAGVWERASAAEESGGGLGRYREAPTTDFPVNEAAAPRRECKQILGAPIFGFDGDIIGVLEVINPVDRLCFSRKDKEFLLSICPHIAVEVEGRQHLTNILEMCRKQVSSHKKKSKADGRKGAAGASSSSPSNSSSNSGSVDDGENPSGSPADSISLFANKFFA